MLQMYKIFNNIDIVDKNKMFQTNLDCITRGNNRKLFKKRVNTAFRKGMFSQRVVNTWNSLPNEVIDAPSINSFKNKLNNFWVGLDIKFEASCYT